MPCYHPIQAWRSRQGRGESGKWGITFNKRDGYQDMLLTIPCGQCIGCRLEHSRQWAIRCVFEAQMHKKNCFITLTYDDQNKPENNSLQKRDVTLFIKKLRKKYGSKIRFFMCGEYGSQLDRPHYHLCMFNHDFEDKKLWNVRDNVKLYRSKELEKLWPKGYTTIGDVTFESAAYVARYCLKKISGEKKEEHYGNRQPEYCNMSRRPGIGKAWWDKYKNDVLSTDKIYLRKGIIAKPPKYFDNQVEQKKLERIKLKRKKLINKEENNWERLAIKENIKKLQSKQLKRGLECRF